MEVSGGRQSDPTAMLSSVQPCFQLLRIGSSADDSARDLYTFRPTVSHCVFRLGRAAELCDVTLDSTSVSRIHAELHAERESAGGEAATQEEGWRVHIKDRSSHGERITESHTHTITVKMRLTSTPFYSHCGREKGGKSRGYKKPEHFYRKRPNEPSHTCTFILSVNTLHQHTASCNRNEHVDLTHTHNHRKTDNERVDDTPKNTTCSLTAAEPHKATPTQLMLPRHSCRCVDNMHR